MCVCVCVCVCVNELDSMIQENTSVLFIHITADCRFPKSKTVNVQVYNG